MKKFEVIRPPNRLKEKVGPSGGPTPEEAVSRAITNLQVMGKDYKPRLDKEVAGLQAALARLNASPDDRAAEMAAIYDIAHELRGQAGSMGFPLVSRITDSLCKFMDVRHNTASREDLLVIKSHIDSLVAAKMQPGDGGELGKALVSDLVKLVVKQLKPGS